MQPATLDDQSDEQLAAEAAREGSDGPAFVELLRRYRERVWRICYRLLDNAEDAHDAAQEVFVRLFTCRKQFAGRSKYSTWVHGVAVRTTLTIRRSRTRQRKRVNTATDESLEQQASSASAAQTREGAAALAMDLSSVLDELSEEDRAMLILKYVEQYNYEELAEMFELSVSACKMRISRARDKLKQDHPDLSV